jgi:hypothetical protein
VSCSQRIRQIGLTFAFLLRIVERPDAFGIS